MKKIYDVGISPIEIEQINSSIYKVYFRENITELSSNKVTCDEYITFIENTSEKSIEDYVNDNKDILSKVNESYSRKVLPFVNHIYVNHLMTGEKNLRGKVMHLSFTKRIRSKFVTIIYYDCKKDNRKIQ